MEKAFAYVCASPDAAPRLLKRYAARFMNWDMSPSARNFRTASICRWKMPMKNGNFKTFPVRSCADAECWWYAAMRSAIPCPLKSVQPKSEILSVRRWKVWQKSRNQMNMTGSDSSVVFSQPVTGFASIAFGYPNASWGEPQTPGIQPPIEYRKR